MKLPELLSPAGNPEKLRAALRYGADAVYLGGKNFSMRQAADNFTEEEIAGAVAEAHAAGAKLYVTVNIVPRWEEYGALERHFAMLREAGADALIVASAGVIRTARRIVPDMELHISTQAAASSHEDCLAYAAMGARRVVLSRELSLDDICEIRHRVHGEVDLEVFVHGAMCVSWSGRCLLSAAMTDCDRSALRGSCTQPCRWNYKLYELEEEERPGMRFEILENDRGTFIMSSKDLCMIEHIPELCESGIASMKIEGRMKSAYYTALTTNAYRIALDAYARGEETPLLRRALLRELESVSHRPYGTGYFFDRIMDGNAQTVGAQQRGYLREKAYIAAVESYDPATGRATLCQRNKVTAGETVEIITPGQVGRPLCVTDLRDADGQPIESAPHPLMRYSIPVPFPVQPGDIVRGS